MLTLVSDSKSEQICIQGHLYITCCPTAIIEHDLKIGSPVYEFMRILGKSMLNTDSIKVLLKPIGEATKPDDGQREINLELNY